MDRSRKEEIGVFRASEQHRMTAQIKELEQKLQQAEALLEEARFNAIKPTSDPKPTYDLQQLLFSLPGGGCLYDYKQRELLAVDEQFCTMFAYPNGELDTTLFFTIFPDSQPDGQITATCLVEARDEAISSGNAQRLRLLFKRIDGTDLPGEVTVVPNPQHGDSVYLIFRDYSASVAQQRALEESEQRYREFIELAPVGICKVDVFGKIQLNSAKADAMLGYDRGENEGNSLLNLVHPEDQPVYAEKVMEMLSGKFEVDFNQVRVRTKSGDYLWLRGGGKLHVDDSGTPLYALITFLDIMAIKKAQAIQLEREAIYQSVVRNAREGIDVIDVSDFHPVDNPVATLMLRNERMRHLFQSDDEVYCTVDAISKMLPEYQPSGEKSIDVIQRIIDRLYREGKSKESLRLQHSDNLYFDAEATEQIVQIGEKRLLIRVHYDMTDRMKQSRLIQQQLKQLNDQNRELQTYIESNMQLENFAYIASHDLRAPIRSIVSFSNLLEKRFAERLQEEEKEYLDFIAQSAVSMQMLIEDLLAFSRANTKKRQLETVALDTIRQDLLLDLQSQIQESEATIAWSRFDHTIVADRIKLRQVLQNLIANALKFIDAQRKPEICVYFHENAEEWIFSVEDNGIGIAEEFQDTIFLIFKRLHTQAEYEGTGIGLALCKKLVEQHDGRIWVEAEEGKGSIFHFSIPKDLTA